MKVLDGEVRESHRLFARRVHSDQLSAIRFREPRTTLEILDALLNVTPHRQPCMKAAILDEQAVLLGDDVRALQSPRPRSLKTIVGTKQEVVVNSSVSRRSVDRDKKAAEVIDTHQYVTP